MAPLYACLSILQVCCRVNTKFLSRIRSNDCCKVSKFQSFTHQRCLFHRFAVSRFHHSQLLPLSQGRCPQGGGVCHPQSKPRLCLFAKKNGYPKVNQDLSVCFWEKKSGGTGCPHRVPRSKPRFICLLWGKAEVHVA